MTSHSLGKETRKKKLKRGNDLTWLQMFKETLQEDLLTFQLQVRLEDLKLSKNTHVTGKKIC